MHAEVYIRPVKQFHRICPNVNAARVRYSTRNRTLHGNSARK